MLRMITLDLGERLEMFKGSQAFNNVRLDERTGKNTRSCAPVKCDLS